MNQVTDREKLHIIEDSEAATEGVLSKKCY